MSCPATKRANTDSSNRLEFLAPKRRWKIWIHKTVEEVCQKCALVCSCSRLLLKDLFSDGQGTRQR
jgi:hypothetical protein